MCILLVSIRNITYQMNHSHCYDFFFNLKTESKYHILQERQKLEYKARKKRVPRMVESNASQSKVAKKSHKESRLLAGKVSKSTVKLHVTRQLKKTADAMQRK